MGSVDKKLQWNFTKFLIWKTGSKILQLNSNGVESRFRRSPDKFAGVLKR